METKTNIPTTAPGATIAEADYESVLQMADTLTGIVTDAQKIAEKYGFPPLGTQVIGTSAAEVTQQLALLASHIKNPDAPEVLDAVRQRIKCGID